MLTGWIDAGRRGRRRGGRGVDRVRHRAAGRASTTTRSSTTGPAARRWSCATASTPTSCGRRSSCAPAATSTATTSCCSPVPSPTWRGTGSPPPSATSPSSSASPRWSASAPTRSPRRTPARRACRARRRRPTCSPACRSPAARSTCRPAWPPRSSTRCTPRTIPALGIWAQVPHYVAAMSYPAASVALLDGLTEVTGITIAGDRPARRRARSSASGSTSSVGDNHEHLAMLHQLEQIYDAADGERERERAADGPGLEMQSGDELAAEIERFLQRAGLSRTAARPPAPATFGGHEGRRRHRNRSRQGRRQRP